MDAFHEQLARTGLAAARRYGFALAGGYAVQAAGLLDATLQSSRYTRKTLLNLAHRADRGFDRRIFADALGQADLLDPDDFAQYGVTDQALNDLRSRFAAWRRGLLDGKHTEADDSVK